MKKIISYILISLIISANLFAPISVGINKGDIEIRRNEVSAAPVTQIGLNSTTATSVSVNGEYTSTDKLNSIKAAYYIGTTTSNLALIDTKDSGTITTDSTGTTSMYGYWFGETISQIVLPGTTVSSPLISGTTYYIKVRIIKTLADGTQTFVVGADSDVLSFISGTASQTGFAVTNEGQVAAQTAYDQAIASGATPEQAQQVVLSKVYDKKTDVSPKSMPACNIPFGGGTFSGCIAQGFYYILFVPSSYLFALAGTMFDYTFSYSVQDSSYRSAFVVQGWGLIRDFCNMFFIFIMLYVAIGTILSLHSMKTKETIVNIVIIGLFINFSLFATQLIIDASNITARVFYNSNAIKITENGVTGATNVVSKIGEGGVIPISAALVNKINPQNLIIHSDQINDIKDSGGKSNPDGMDASTFILIVLVTSAVNIVGFTVFLTIAFLFIARVIGLWLAMIMAPLAFFTYILPEMSSIKMIGWKNWWPDTLKMAFLAPVFIFFMYLILKFLEMDLIADTINKTGLAWFVATIVPFIFIMIFMIKAKKIATDMSGEFGEIVTKAGSAVGGMALGGAVGAGAFAMRGTIGAIGDKVANNDWLKTHGGRLGNLARDAGKWTASKSFDVRSTTLGGGAMKGMGVDAGKAKEGGYAKHKTDVTERRRERAESKKLGNNTPEVQALHGAEEEFANLKNENINDTNRVDGTLTARRLVSNDLSQKLTAANSKLAKTEKALEEVKKLDDTDPNKATAVANAQADLSKVQNEAKTAQDNFDDISSDIADLVDERKELKAATGRYAHRTGDGKVNEAEYIKFQAKVAQTKLDLQALLADPTISATKKEAGTKKQESLEKLLSEMTKAANAGGQGKGFSKPDDKARSLDELELSVIPKLHHHVEKENADRVNVYTKNIRGRFFNKEANDVAAHEAIMRSEIKKH